MHMNKAVELQQVTHNHKNVLKQGLGTLEEEKITLGVEERKFLA